MTRIGAIAAVAASACIACATAGIAMAAEEVPTTVTGFSWTDADGDTDYFDGHIAAAKDKCLTDRRVSLYRKEQGRDPRVGRTQTDKAGKWLLKREDPGTGNYYLKVKKADAGGIVCLRAKAGTLYVRDLDGV